MVKVRQTKQNIKKYKKKNREMYKVNISLDKQPLQITVPYLPMQNRKPKKGCYVLYYPPYNLRNKFTNFQ